MAIVPHLRVHLHVMAADPKPQAMVWSWPPENFVLLKAGGRDVDVVWEGVIVGGCPHRRMLTSLLLHGIV